MALPIVRTIPISIGKKEIGSSEVKAHAQKGGARAAPAGGSGSMEAAGSVRALQSARMNSFFSILTIMVILDSVR